MRIVFVMTILIAHFIELFSIQSFQPYMVYINGRLALDGFFIISGFLIAKSYENSASLKNYISRRLRRLLPGYITVILLCAIFLFFLSTNTMSNYFLNGQFWRYLAANLTFQNYLEPCLPGVFESQKICVVNGALWTIKIEEAFYLSLPILYWLSKKMRFNFYIIIIITYIASIAYFNFFMAHDNYRIAKQLPGAFAFFASGILMYKKFDLLFDWKHYIIAPCLFLFIMEQYIFNTQILKPITYGVMVFYLAYTLQFLNNFGKYGDFTYGIYIYHFPVIQVFVALKLFRADTPLLMFIGIFSLILFLAFLSWVFIELQFLPPSRRSRHKQIFRSRFKYSK